MDEIKEVDTLPAIADNTLIQLAEQAEKRMDAMNKIKRVALKSTNVNDWCEQGSGDKSKPYLMESGANKVGRVFGVSWRIDKEPVKEHEEGGHYSYTYTGEFSLAGATIEAVGVRSSKDGFFKKYDYSTGQKTDLPASAIDVGDVKKAAVANCIVNGVTRLIGLRNLTWDDLKEYAGITKDQIAKVEYKDKGKEISSEGANTIQFSPSGIVKREGKNEKTGKPWTKFIIKDGDTEYSTFSETFAKDAKTAQEAGIRVSITFKASKYGNEIENLVRVEPPREPGDE